MVHLSSGFNPPVLKGIKVHPENPFRFDFILDKGDSKISGDQLKQESNRLIKYFLASLTVPEKDLWVNLSPYEKDRIVPEAFGQTEMGRDLLAQDYLLKQITASLIYPEDEIGKKFWKRIYEEAANKFGTTNIPLNTFNKVWIVPEKAVVYENAQAGTAYVVESRLTVMLEEDYLSLKRNSTQMPGPVNEANALGSKIVREVVIPQLTKEVNDGRNFAHLRQVYNSLILATWYKKKVKDSILEQVYTDKNKVAGVNINDPQEKQKIYERYLQAFKKGVYNYVRDEVDQVAQETAPRKYFSGGVSATNMKLVLENARDPGDIGFLGDRAMVISTLLQQFFPSRSNRAVSVESEDEQGKQSHGRDGGTEEVDPSRRMFLKGAAAMAALAALPPAAVRGTMVQTTKLAKTVWRRAFATGRPSHAHALGHPHLGVLDDLYPGLQVKAFDPNRFPAFNGDVSLAGEETFDRRITDEKVEGKKGIILYPLNRLIAEELKKSRNFPMALIVEWRLDAEKPQARLVSEAAVGGNAIELHETYVRELLTMIPINQLLGPGEFKRVFFEGPLSAAEVDQRLRISLGEDGGAREPNDEAMSADPALEAPSAVTLSYQGNADIQKNGGIDLTSDQALSVQNNGKGIKLDFDPAMGEQWRSVSGFTPVIIHIQPLTDLRLFLGLNHAMPPLQ